MASDNDVHVHFLRLALAEAQKCIPTSTAFCVGCVIVQSPTPSIPQSQPIVLSTGYSREVPGNTHAEANALEKLAQSGDSPERLDLYTTLEPCSVRLSGLQPCSEAIVQSGRIKRVFVGVGEPDDFVKCEGAKYLEEHGVEVVWIKELQDECLKEARRGHEDGRS